MRHLSFRALVVLSVLLVTPSSAWPAAPLDRLTHNDSRIPTKSGKLDRDQTLDLVRNYATCIVKYQRNLASRYVLDRALNTHGKYSALNDTDCLFSISAVDYDEVAVAIRGSSFRFALAEALLGDELAAIDPAVLAKAPPLSQPLLDPADYKPKGSPPYSAEILKKLDDDRARDQVVLLMYRLGDCTIRANPVETMAVLKASPGSSDEAAAFQSLVPTLASCVEKGASLKFDRQVLRGVLAFSYYSLAHAPGASGVNSVRLPESDASH